MRPIRLSASRCIRVRWPLGSTRLTWSPPPRSRAMCSWPRTRSATPLPDETLPDETLPDETILEVYRPARVQAGPGPVHEKGHFYTERTVPLATSDAQLGRPWSSRPARQVGAGNHLIGGQRRPEDGLPGGGSRGGHA